MKQKVIISLISISLFSPLSSISAQSVDSVMVDVLQSSDYEIKIEEQRNSIITLQKSIDKLLSENESLKKQVDKKNIKYLRSQIDSLNNSVLILRDSISVAENATQDLKIKLDATNKEILLLNDKIAILSNIKDMYIQSQIDEVNHYLAKPYSELSDSIFANYIRILSPISDTDVIVKDLIVLLELKRRNFNEYEDIDNCLTNNTYSKQLSQELDCRIDSLIKQSNPVQANELKLLKEAIAAYPRAISEFQFIVRAIRDQVDYMRVEMPSAKEIEDANSAAKLVVDNNKIRLERSYKYSISKVPRLKNQYDKYLETITVNSLSKDAVLIEEEILSLLNN